MMAQRFYPERYYSDPPLVLYHGGCVDGFCAAWVANRFFRSSPGSPWDEGEFRAVDYQTSPPADADYKDRAVYILDFSFKRDVLRHMAVTAAKLTLLDHHKTAQEDLAHFPDNNEPTIVFDMAKSGALLAWEHFFPEKIKEVPWLIRYVMDRDLWTWKLPLSREVNAAIYSYPFDFDEWDSMHRFASHTLLAEQGRHILRFQDKLVEQGVRHAREVTLAGHKVLAANTPYFYSEIAGALAEGRPFGVCWTQLDDGRFRFDLRSREGGIDVSEVAKQYGGGGHKQAAGFKTWTFPFEDDYPFLKERAG
jgi:oligoribonuclease NrnB/cAMP/cGMP phosphodiesterase (DHH superfamily)